MSMTNNAERTASLRNSLEALEEKRAEARRFLTKWEESKGAVERELERIALPAVSGDKEAAKEVQELFWDLEYAERCVKLARLALEEGG